MRSFPTAADAAVALAGIIDRPAEPRDEPLADGLWLRVAAVVLADGSFTNRYTLSWSGEQVRVALPTPDPPRSPHAHAGLHPEVLACASGSYFFLADRCPWRPRCLNLNLCLQGGRIHSLPVADQEALVCRAGRLSVQEVPARGALWLGGERLRWAGARTRHDADCIVYGNASCVIRHRHHPDLGRVRQLDPDSRFTPAPRSGTVDLGCTRREADLFEVVEVIEDGGIDIFAHDLVLRCPRAAAPARGGAVRIESIDGLALEAGLDVVSAGPSLLDPDPARHPRDRDPSLGSFPLLSESRAARLAFYRTADGLQHLSLLDGRPGSPCFSGVTLGEALGILHRGEAIESGCWLDSGNTSRLCVRRGREVQSFGSRHYLRWPEHPGEGYLWTPDEGRPTASLIALSSREP